MKKKRLPKFGSKLKVNNSYTFLNKNVCSKCGGPPTFYFFMKAANSYKEVQHCNNNVNFILKHKKKLISSYYLLGSPKEFNSLVGFKVKNNLKYKINYHKSKHIENMNGSLLIDCLSCKCRQTVWEFKQTTSSPETNARHARTFNPIKFIY